MEMYQDGVEVFCLPDEAFCMADEEQRSPLQIETCPFGKNSCTGDCMYYSEDAKSTTRIQVTENSRPDFLKQESGSKSIQL